MTTFAADDQMAAVLAAEIAADDKSARAPKPALERRMPWPDEWFRQTDPFDIVACQRMWGAVLLTCMRGALGISGEFDNRTAGKVSSDWIGSRDFIQVCDYAGVDAVGLQACLADPPRRAALIEALRQGAAG